MDKEDTGHGGRGGEEPFRKERWSKVSDHKRRGLISARKERLDDKKALGKSERILATLRGSIGQ